MKFLFAMTMITITILHVKQGYLCQHNYISVKVGETLRFHVLSLKFWVKF